jgi:hypothetical protein
VLSRRGRYTIPAIPPPCGRMGWMARGNEGGLWLNPSCIVAVLIINCLSDALVACQANRKAIVPRRIPAIPQRMLSGRLYRIEQRQEKASMGPASAPAIPAPVAEVDQPSYTGGGLGGRLTTPRRRSHRHPLTPSPPQTMPLLSRFHRQNSMLAAARLGYGPQYTPGK